MVLEFLDRLLQKEVELLVPGPTLLDLLTGVKDGGVIPPPEVGADLLEGVVGELPGQVHADLAREGDRLEPALGLQVGHPQPEALQDSALDGLDVHPGARRA